MSCGASIPDGQTCGRCAPASGKWTILAGNERLELDRASLRAALISGKVLGNDRILDNGREVLVAAHPAFRTWFVAGHKDALPSRGARRWWICTTRSARAGPTSVMWLW